MYKTMHTYSQVVVTSKIMQGRFQYLNGELGQISDKRGVWFELTAERSKMEFQRDKMSFKMEKVY